MLGKVFDRFDGDGTRKRDVDDIFFDNDELTRVTHDGIQRDDTILKGIYPTFVKDLLLEALRHLEAVLPLHDLIGKIGIEILLFEDRTQII